MTANCATHKYEKVFNSKRAISKLRILVLGYSGFFGRHFLKYCQSKEHELILVGRAPSPVLLSARDFWVQSEITDFQSKLDKFGKIDALANFVWQGLPRRTTELNQMNLILHSKILSQVREMPFSKVLCVGSCLEYPLSNRNLVETSPVDKENEFSKTKSKVLEMYMETFENVVWPRVFFAYGSGQHKDSLLNTAFDSFINNLDLVLRSPSELQDYVHITDVVRAFEMLISKTDCQGIFNVGSGVGVKNGKICDVLLDLMRNPGHSLRQKERVSLSKISDANQSLFRVADISKIRREVGWDPQIDVEKGIYEFLKSKCK